MKRVLAAPLYAVGVILMWGVAVPAGLAAFGLGRLSEKVKR